VLKNLISGDVKQQSDFRPSPALIEKFVIRLPKGIRKKIKHSSEQNRRSMNSEIIMVLEQHIQQNLMDNTDQAGR
jgi:predicted HicB family RNase H-like nuclease